MVQSQRFLSNFESLIYQNLFLNYYEFALHLPNKVHAWVCILNRKEAIEMFSFLFIFLNFIFHWKSEMTLTPQKHLQVYKLKQSDPREYLNLPFYVSCFVKWDISSSEKSLYRELLIYPAHRYFRLWNLRDHPKIIFIFPGDNFV